MKRSILLLIAVCLAFGLQAQTIETASDAVKNMGLGWNLGNTLDANNHNGNIDVTKDSYWGGQGLDSETCWGQKETKKELFTMMKNAGFGAIRVPVTWYNHMDKDGKVDAKWMARVHQIVDWCLEAGLYCIINVHHDTGADSGDTKSWLKADMATYNKQKSRYENLWKQIATEFKDYDQRLLFESYNEMLDIYNSWCFATYNSPNKYDATVAADAYNAINNYAQSFVNVVRATGGNNGNRNLIVNTYGACCGEGTWNQYLTDPLSNMKLPNDKTKNHLIFQVHTYPNISSGNITNIKAGIDQTIKALKTNLVSKGAPVIVGEWGTSNVDAGGGKTDYDVRRNVMLQFCEYFVKQMKTNNIATFYWMGLTDGSFRTHPAFNQPDLAECLAKAYHGSTFKGEYPEYVQPAEVEVFNGTKVLAWGDAITIEAAVFKNAGEKCEVEISYTQTKANGEDDIQLCYSDVNDGWKWKGISFIVDGKTFSTDFNPSKVYNTAANKDHVTVFTLPKADYDKLTQFGLIIHGSGITVKKVIVRDPVKADLDAITIAPTDASAAYNLAGQRVGNDYKGIIIKNGKKIIKK